MPLRLAGNDFLAAYGYSGTADNDFGDRVRGAAISRRRRYFREALRLDAELHPKAHADEDRLGIGRISHFAAQGAAFDFHISLRLRDGLGRMTQAAGLC